MEEQEQYQERKKKIKDVIYSPEYKPMKYKELAYLFQVAEEDKPVLSRILDELIREGLVMKTPKGKFQKPEEYTVCGGFFVNPVK